MVAPAATPTAHHRLLDGPFSPSSSSSSSSSNSGVAPSPSSSFSFSSSAASTRALPQKTPPPPPQPPGASSTAVSAANTPTPPPRSASARRLGSVHLPLAPQNDVAGRTYSSSISSSDTINNNNNNNSNPITSMFTATATAPDTGGGGSVAAALFSGRRRSSSAQNNNSLQRRPLQNDLLPPATTTTTTPSLPAQLDKPTQSPKQNWTNFAKATQHYHSDPSLPADFANSLQSPPPNSEKSLRTLGIEAQAPDLLPYKSPTLAQSPSQDKHQTPRGVSFHRKRSLTVLTDGPTLKSLDSTLLYQGPLMKKREDFGGKLVGKWTKGFAVLCPGQFFFFLGNKPFERAQALLAVSLDTTVSRQTNQILEVTSIYSGRSLSWQLHFEHEEELKVWEKMFRRSIELCDPFKPSTPRGRNSSQSDFDSPSTGVHHSPSRSSGDTVYNSEESVLNAEYKRLYSSGNVPRKSPEATVEIVPPTPSLPTQSLGEGGAMHTPLIGLSPFPRKASMSDAVEVPTSSQLDTAQGKPTSRAAMMKAIEQLLQEHQKTGGGRTPGYGELLSFPWFGERSTSPSSLVSSRSPKVVSQSIANNPAPGSPGSQIFGPALTTPMSALPPMPPASPYQQQQSLFEQQSQQQQFGSLSALRNYLQSSAEFVSPPQLSSPNAALPPHPDAQQRLPQRPPSAARTPEMSPAPFPAPNTALPPLPVQQPAFARSASFQQSGYPSYDVSMLSANGVYDPRMSGQHQGGFGTNSAFSVPKYQDKPMPPTPPSVYHAMNSSVTLTRRATTAGTLIPPTPLQSQSGMVYPPHGSVRIGENHNAVSGILSPRGPVPSVQPPIEAMQYQVQIRELEQMYKAQQLQRQQNPLFRQRSASSGSAPKYTIPKHPAPTQPLPPPPPTPLGSSAPSAGPHGSVLLRNETSLLTMMAPRRVSPEKPEKSPPSGPPPAASQQQQPPPQQQQQQQHPLQTKSDATPPSASSSSSSLSHPSLLSSPGSSAPLNLPRDSWTSAASAVPLGAVVIGGSPASMSPPFAPSTGAAAVRTVPGAGPGAAVRRGIPGSKDVVETALSLLDASEKKDKMEW
ncbi:hypothetical protein DFJ73DRAFT_796648 [Zopfochytrium polystomum]|nr:hypothetical protein DFJ73DRAFT_796648 [Zopfochytrium polystomum]